MKYLLLLISFNTYALTFEIKNLCHDSAYFSQDIANTDLTNVGAVTIEMLQENNIPFQGTPAGINTMLGTPVGFDSYEIISDTRMRVYGWCYNIDGENPVHLAEQYLLTPNSKKTITWFYGYAEVYKNDWLNYCVPVYKKPTEFACH